MMLGRTTTASRHLVWPHDPGLANVDVECLLQAVELALAGAHPDDLERVVQVRRIRVRVAEADTGLSVLVGEAGVSR
jgi:hypothetical protein